MVCERKIVNYDTINRELTKKRIDFIKISSPALPKNEKIEIKNTDNPSLIKSKILEVSKMFPHRKVILSFKTTGQELTIEVHPVTDTA